MTPEQFQRVEEVFHEAVTLPAKDRMAFLDRVFEGDSELRAQAESLLAADGSAGNGSLPSSAGSRTKTE